MKDEIDFSSSDSDLVHSQDFGDNFDIDKGEIGRRVKIREWIERELPVRIELMPSELFRRRLSFASTALVSIGFFFLFFNTLS